MNLKVVFSLFFVEDNCKLGVILLENKYHKCSSLVLFSLFLLFPRNIQKEIKGKKTTDLKTSC